MLAPAGVPIAFSAYFAGATPGFTAMVVYDVTTNTPTIAQAAAVMTNFGGSFFTSKFTPTAGKAYAVILAVYLDGTFASLNTSYTPVVESINAQYLTPPVSSVVGLVNCSGGT